MILPQFILLFSALFCISSALKFSTFKKIKRGRWHSGYQLLTKHDTSVLISPKIRERLPGLQLSLKGDKLVINNGVFSICVCSENGAPRCYERVGDMDVRLAPGDVLVAGHFILAEKSIKTALKKSFPLKKGFSESDFSRHLSPKVQNIEVFVILIEDDKTKKTDTDSALKFSKFLKGGKPINPDSSDSLLYLKSDMSFQAQFTPNYGKIAMTLIPQTKGLKVSSDRTFLCIYRKNEVDKFYQDIQVENAQLAPGDIVISGLVTDVDDILGALDKSSQSGETHKGLDFLKEVPVAYGTEFFAVEIKGVKAEKADTNLELKFSKVETDEPTKYSMYQIVRHDKSIEIIPKHPEISAKISLFLGEGLRLLGNKFFVCICRNKEIEGLYRDAEALNVRQLPGDILVFGHEYEANRVVAALGKIFSKNEDPVNIDSINKAMPPIGSMGIFVTSIKGNMMHGNRKRAVQSR